ncbi:MAG: substrate-binding domain-containing protein, partial [Pseudomonadota bacterium]|nr:substrate-binding domain-containing protein [Pseudomonadota bacterium]
IIHSDNPYTGELKLTCSGSIAMLLYPKLLNIQKQHSELIVSVEAAPNLAIVDRVASLQSDVGIVTQPVKDSSLALSQIGEDELCLILPAGVTLSWEALLELGFINHPDGYHYATQILEKNFKDEFSGMNQIPASGKVNQLSQILTPVSMGLGFTALPRSAVEAFPFPERIQIAGLSTRVTEPVYLIIKQHRTLQPRYQLLIELLEKLWSSKANVD